MAPDPAAGAKIQASPYAQDEDLVARERALINQQPLSTRVYGRLKRLLEHDENLKPVSLSDLGGPQSELVFSRKSGKPVSEGVRGSIRRTATGRVLTTRSTA